MQGNQPNYTGRTTVDAGFFYCPYIPLMSTDSSAIHEQVLREIKAEVDQRVDELEKM